GIDRLELRRRNLLARGEDYVPGRAPVDADLLGDLEAVARASGWERTRGAEEGCGIAIGISPGGASRLSEARVELVDGTIVVHGGWQEIGQGPRTVHGEVAAEPLGLDPSLVTVPATDTTRTPYDRSTGASRSTTVAGTAVQQASLRL